MKSAPPITAVRSGSEWRSLRHDLGTCFNQPEHVLRVVCVDDPTEPLRHGGDQGNNHSDLMDPTRWVARPCARCAEQLAGPVPILRKDRFGAELGEHDVDPANVRGPLPSFYQNHGGNHEDLRTELNHEGSHLL